MSDRGERALLHRHKLDGGDDESKAFGMLAANQARPMLELRFLKGTHFALGYAYLVSAGKDGDTIALGFAGHRVTIEGRNLDKLFRALVDHKVAWVREGDEFDTGIPEGAPLVSRITLNEL